MPFDPHLAAVRFGTGLGPRHAPPASADEMLRRLRGPDRAAALWPVARSAEAVPSQVELNEAARAVREGTEAERMAALDRQAAMREAARAARAADFRAHLARRLDASDGLRERLHAFWADHLTAVARNGPGVHFVSAYWEEAIRPHLAGSFPAMLEAAILHPTMLRYLDGARSVGPDSRAGLNGGRGLNENLARELLELHTLGVDGPYSQADVRELAELLTGLSLDRDGLFGFDPRRAQPGAETVLGVAYAEDASLDNVRAALRDLALHPATARHLAGKLARHFVADAAPPALVADLADAYRATDGDLLAVTEALLRHPAAWSPERLKVKQPFEFVASALRALGVGGASVVALGLGDTRRLFIAPMSLMGQPWQEPPGPDGWPEEAEAWVTPQGVAARIDWAMERPEALMARIGAELPDPRDLAEVALGPLASGPTLYAARAAERRGEGVGVVLASADFQRR